MQDGRYVIRPMNPAEVGTAVDWAASEGWNPGLQDAECYAVADPGGFFVGLLDGEAVAAISAIRYGAAFGFVGLYIVRPDHRGKGYGLQIWNAGMSYLEGRNVGLDGVVAQQDNYRKSGFRLAYRNVRYQGTGGGRVSENPDIVPLSALPFEAIEAYERPFFPAERSAFLRAWIGQADGNALGILQNGRLRGYGVSRRCRSGFKIGPLFADTADLSEALFLALRARVPPSDPVYLDTPSVNPAAVELAERHGMSVVFETARMYTRGIPDLPLHRIFGVTSFEVG
jgi:GNAT superfamily N-acetyltransferase